MQRQGKRLRGGGLPQFGESPPGAEWKNAHYACYARTGFFETAQSPAACLGMGRLFAVNRLLSLAVIASALTLAAASKHAIGAEYWLADRGAFPGGVWHVADGGRERLVHRREATADPAFPAAIMKVGRVAAAPDGAFYFCSGLDGCVLALIDGGRHEVLSFEVDGQVRDIACGGEDHVVYFSVVPTPQDGEPLADGTIYRRDLWQGVAAKVATIHQADVGGNWWGTFCVRDGVLTIATLDESSRLFRLTSGAPEAVYEVNTRKILGLEAAGDHFYLTDGSGEVVRTVDFTTFEPVHRAAINASDVTVRGK